MPILKEYRIPLPLQMDEFEKARLWHKVEQARLEKILVESDASKVDDFQERIVFKEIVHSNDRPRLISSDRLIATENVEHIVKEFGSPGPNTSKPLARIPSANSFLDAIFANCIKINRIDSWEAYPYYSSISTNCHLGSRYNMVIEALTLPGYVNEDNPLKLSEDDLKRRKVVIVDIAEKVDGEDYRKNSDPAVFKSKTTKRGLLKPGAWIEEIECYKNIEPITVCILVDIRYDFLGPIGLIAEERLHCGIYRSLLLHHRELFCSIDKWFDIPKERLLTAVEETQKALDEVIKQSNVSSPAFYDPVKKTSENEMVGSEVTSSSISSVSDFVRDFKWFFCGYFDDRSTVTETSGNSIIIFALIVSVCVGIAVAGKIYS